MKILFTLTCQILIINLVVDMKIVNNAEKYRTSNIFIIFAALGWISSFVSLLMTLSLYFSDNIYYKSLSITWLIAFVSSSIFTALFSALNKMGIKVEELEEKLNKLTNKETKDTSVEEDKKDE